MRKKAVGGGGGGWQLIDWDCSLFTVSLALLSICFSFILFFLYS